MNNRSLISLILIIPILLGSVAFVGAPPPGTNTDIAIHGTAWRPEQQANFSMWSPRGWGTEVKAKAAGWKWVHAPVASLPVINGIAQNLVYVEFCAASSNGASTKPTRMDVYDLDVKILQQALSWWSDNALHCTGKNFTPAWHQELGISVLLYFANTSDMITLYKAWARYQP
jgi:hypothetical protein